MNPSLSLLSSIEHYKKGIEPWAIDETAANLFKRARRRTLMTGFAEVDAVCGGVEPGQVLEASKIPANLCRLSIAHSRFGVLVGVAKQKF